MKRAHFVVGIPIFCAFSRFAWKGVWEWVAIGHVWCLSSFLLRTFSPTCRSHWQDVRLVIRRLAPPYFFCVFLCFLLPRKMFIVVTTVASLFYFLWKGLGVFRNWGTPERCTEQKKESLVYSLRECLCRTACPLSYGSLIIFCVEGRRPFVLGEGGWLLVWVGRNLLYICLCGSCGFSFISSTSLWKSCHLPIHSRIRLLTHSFSEHVSSTYFQWNESECCRWNVHLSKYHLPVLWDLARSGEHCFLEQGWASPDPLGENSLWHLHSSRVSGQYRPLVQCSGLQRLLKGVENVNSGNNSKNSSCGGSSSCFTESFQVL